MIRGTKAAQTMAAIAAVIIGLTGVSLLPPPESHPLVQLVAIRKPDLATAITWTYLSLWFSTPYLMCSILASLTYIFTARRRGVTGSIQLPLYPDPAGREKLFVVVGEVHQAKRPAPVENPRWLVIPERGLFTGTMIFGAIGSGKTTGCMYPFAEQVLAYRPASSKSRVGGLVLEVKGDFCQKVKEILTKHGRQNDYVELSLTTRYRYNPLHNDLDAYALAYGIASLLNNLFGRGKEPFWQQAYTNLIKFVILLHKVLYNYVTLFDVYRGVIDPDYLAREIEKGDRIFTNDFVTISIEDFLGHRDLEAEPFEPDGNLMKAPVTESLKKKLDAAGVAYQITSLVAAIDEEKRQQFEAVVRWFEHDWQRIEMKLRTSIVEGVSVFLSLFDDNPAVKRIFCPPKETYDPVANSDGRHGIPLPPFAELLEQGVVCALNFPISANPGLAKAIGTMLKQDFQRAALNRIPRMEREPQKTWAPILFLCDEYHSFATVGESDPSGDEKFFALSRQAKCIPIVATQSISSLRSTLPGESWRTLLQTFRTKIFLSLSDDFSARCASELCGKEEQLKLNYSFSENGQDAGINVFSGRAAAPRATLSTSKGYNVQRDFIFEPKVFTELKNAQAIVLAYDGFNPYPATFCYLKPYFLDPNTSYFSHLAKGAL